MNREQGLPERVTDQGFLGQLAAEVVDHDAPTVELPAVVIPFPVGGDDLDPAA